MIAALPDIAGISRGPLLLGHRRSGRDLRRAVCLGTFSVLGRAAVFVLFAFPGQLGGNCDSG